VVEGAQRKTEALGSNKKLETGDNDLTSQNGTQIQEKTSKTLTQYTRAISGLLIVLVYVVIGILVGNRSLVTNVLLLLVMVSGMTVYIYYSLPDSYLKNQKEEGCTESGLNCSS
jgi:hypothetical protein